MTKFRRIKKVRDKMVILERRLRQLADATEVLGFDGLSVQLDSLHFMAEGTLEELNKHLEKEQNKS